MNDYGDAIAWSETIQRTQLERSNKIVLEKIERLENVLIRCGLATPEDFGRVIKSTTRSIEWPV